VFLNVRPLRLTDFTASLGTAQRGQVIGYRFTSDGHEHNHLVHDWEVQAAYLAYRRRYNDKALAKLQEAYGERIPTHNPHFIMGTMKAHPQTFIIIGILRSGLDPTELDRHGGLF